MTIRYLTAEEALGIHQVIVADFAETEDPISPAGVRDYGLLESAVFRQHTGFRERLKYETPLLAAASLTFGVCCDHPFHNGNKRTALISMLVHLDRNGYWIPGVGQDEFRRVMVAIADHRPDAVANRRTSPRKEGRRSADEEVWAISAWLHERAQRIVRGERVLTCRQLRRALSPFGVEVEVKGTRAELVAYYQEPRTLFRREQRGRHKFGEIAYRDEGTDISKGEVKRVRDMCGLTEEQGIDSESFYSSGLVVDDFVLRYRKALQRLART